MSKAAVPFGRYSLYSAHASLTDSGERASGRAGERASGRVYAATGLRAAVHYTRR